MPRGRPRKRATQDSSSESSPNSPTVGSALETISHLSFTEQVIVLQSLLRRLSNQINTTLELLSHPTALVQHPPRDLQVGDYVIARTPNSRTGAYPKGHIDRIVEPTIHFVDEFGDSHWRHRAYVAYISDAPILPPRP